MFWGLVIAKVVCVAIGYILVLLMFLRIFYITQQT